MTMRTVLDLAGAALGLAAFVVLLGIRRRAGLGWLARLALVAVGLVSLRELLDGLGTLLDTTALETFEDFADVLVPVALFLVLHTFRLERAQREIGEAEARHRTLVENIDVGVALVDAAGQVVQGNAAMARFVGRREEELVGRSWREELVGPSTGRTLRAVRSVAAGREGWAGELSGVGAGGTPLAARVRSLPLAAAPAGSAIVVVEDLTEILTTRDALEQSRANLDAMLSSTDELVWSVDREHRLITFNHAFADFFRTAYGVEMRAGTLLADVVPPERRPFWQEAHDRALRGERVRCDYLLRTGRYLDIAFHPIRRDEEIVGVSVFGKDVTERRAAEEAFRRSEERLRTVLDHAPLALVAFDPDGTITFCEGSGLGAFRLAPGELVGQRLFERFADVPALVAGARRALSGEPVALRLAVGGVHAETHFGPIRNADGAVAGAIGVALDVTQRHEMEAQRERLEEQLRHAQKMEAVGQLAGGVAHDFNNLLQAIQGYTDLARASLAPGAPAYADLDEVANATTRARELTRRLLAFSRRDPLRCELLDLDELVRGVTRILQRLLGEQIEIRVAHGAGGVGVSADRSQLEQAVMNLCVNARDAMPHGGRITIATGVGTRDAEAAAAWPGTKPGRYVWLSVADTGSGIPREVRDRIYEPFFTTKPEGAGTGLGLATVYAVVKRHDGMIDLDSRPGEGTTFVLHFPAAEAVLGPPEDISAPAPVPGGRETVLVAEDEEAVRRLLERLLERAGYRLIVARDGEEAIALLDDHGAEVDLALLDVVMPRRSGRDVHEAIRQRGLDCPVLFCSGYARDGIGSTPLPADAELLAKPFSREELLRRVRALLDGYARTRRD